MRPVPVPENWCERMLEPGTPFRTLVFSAPSGDLTDPHCGAVEAIVRQASTSPTGEPAPVIGVLWKLEDGDIERLAAGGLILFDVWGSLPPHQLQVVDP